MIKEKNKKKKVLSVKKGYECTYERARTPEQRKEFMDRLLKAWNRTYDQRFLQFLCNYGPEGDPFFPEDFDLVGTLEFNLGKEK